MTPSAASPPLAPAGSSRSVTSGSVGDDGFKRTPVGAGPHKFVSFRSGVELVLEANEQYWRKTTHVKTLIMRSVPDDSTSPTGETELAYLFRGALLTEELKRTPGSRSKPVTRHLLTRLHQAMGSEVPMGGSAARSPPARLTAVAAKYGFDSPVPHHSLHQIDIGGIRRCEGLSRSDIFRQRGSPLSLSWSRVDHSPTATVAKPPPVLS